MSARLKLFGVLLLVLVFSAAAPALPVRAEMPAEEEGIQEAKEVTGKVIYVRKNSISVEFDRHDGGSYERLIPVDEDVHFISPLKGMADIQRGDTVRVSYNQTHSENEHGERVVLKTVATQIALMKPAAQNALSSEGEGMR